MQSRRQEPPCDGSILVGCSPHRPNKLLLHTSHTESYYEVEMQAASSLRKVSHHSDGHSPTRMISKIEADHDVNQRTRKIQVKIILQVSRQSNSRDVDTSSSHVRTKRGRCTQPEASQPIFNREGKPVHLNQRTR